jgi:hypothetical protein
MTLNDRSAGMVFLRWKEPGPPRGGRVIDPTCRACVFYALN